MENRFGIKDFFLFLVLFVLIGLVVLAMVQYDRQWELQRQTNALLTQQTTDLSRIRRLLEQGVSFNSNGGAPTTQSASSMTAGFERVLAAHAAPDFAAGGQLLLMSQATTARLTPLIASDAFAFDVWGYVMDSLVNRDPDTLQWLPSLAQSWKISDDSLTIDFQLRRGITFSDGSPFSADDVVFTFDFMRNPQVEDPIMRIGAERLDHVEKTGDYSVRFVFKEPYYKSFETAGGTPIMSKAFYAKYSPTDFNNSTGLLIGSGPYRLPDPTSWRPQPGQPIVLVRNERYWGPTPSFDRIVWNVIEQPSARVTAFRNGDIDFMGGQGPPTPEQFTQLIADQQLAPHINHWALTSPAEAWYYLGWNEKQGLNGKPSAFADPRVRRAMTMLTDRDAILKNIIHGYGAILSSPFPPNTPQCDPSIQPWPYDPVAAEKLLAEAGFHRTGDRMIGPAGQPLTFKLLFNSNSEPRRRIASLLHDAYAKLGIDAQSESAEWSVFEQRLKDRQYDCVIGAWGGALEGDPYEELHSSQIEHTGENFIQFNNPDVDKVIEQARATVDEAKRMPMWHKLHQLIHDQQPYTYLFIYRELDIARDRIHGMKPTKVLGLNPLGEWYIPQALQRAQ
ncbi:MAG TPA: ABC transporter substrate-binding protein [Tepidisphaeraceae bacterium]|nr:ABC transporter substrate-binding protein [Tepidisphaeraceae bacterium]